MKTKQTQVTQSRTNKKVKEDKPEEEEEEQEEQSRFQQTTRRRGTQILTELYATFRRFGPFRYSFGFYETRVTFPNAYLVCMVS